MLDILLPFYGDPAYLRKAVDSVRRQTCPDWRLIVVDDCYPDPAVGAWLRGITDPRVTYHRNAENLGANLNYRRALALATADYLTVMGADDVMLPNYVSVTRRMSELSPGVEVVAPGVRVVDAAGEPVEPLVDRVKRALRPRAVAQIELAGERLARSLLRGNWTYFPSLCWRRESVERIGIRPDFDVVQDLGLLLDVVRDGGRMVLDPEVAFSYRRHVGSDSGVKTASGVRFEEERSLFALAASEMHEAGWPRAARAARLHLTSRLHAVSLLPELARRRDVSSLSAVAHHALAW